MPEASEQARRRLGTTLRGRYRLEQLIATGGMAVVYRAVHRNGNRFAVKFLHERFLHDADALHRFAREARVANRVGHPSALQVIDDDVDHDGVFLVMPLLEGETVRERWDRMGRRLPLEEVVAITLHLLEVLEAAHSKGIVHRDIKPENLFLTTEGRLFVLDFGIARLLDPDDPLAATSTGQALGTPAFMAPEQALGRTRQIDARTDLWSVGATMFTLLSGQFVHEGENPNELRAQVATQAARPIRTLLPSLPSEMQAVIDKAIAFDRDARWPSSSEMRTALVHASRACALDPSALVVPAGLPAPPVATAATAASAAESTIEPRSSLPTTDAGLVAKIRRPRATRRTILALTAIAAAALLGAGAWTASRRHLSTDTSSAASSTTPPNAPAAGLVAAGRRAFLDAGIDEAIENFARAVSLDPSNVQAHLRLVASSGTPNATPVREHFQRAEQLRDGLDAKDRALLTACEPMFAPTPDRPEAVRRLVALAETYPKDPEYAAYAGWAALELGEIKEVLRIADLIEAADPQIAFAWLLRGKVHLLSDDSEAAMTELEKCAQLSPQATSCLEQVNDLEANAGRCDVAEQISLRQIAADPSSESFYLNLARALYGRGADAASVHAAIDQAIARAAEGEADTEKPKYQFLVDVLEGKFKDAGDVLSAWEAAEERTAEAGSLALVTQEAIDYFLELGDKRRADQIARDYLAKQPTLLKSARADYSIYGLVGRYHAGGIDSVAFARARGAWETSWLELRPHDSDAKARAWGLAYAKGALTPDDAKDALAKLDEYNGLLYARYRPDILAAIGRTYLLAAQYERAADYLGDVVQSCHAVMYPFEHTRAALGLGSALEHLGRRDEACRAYGIVLDRWGAERQSVSAQNAASRARQLGCTL